MSKKNIVIGAGFSGCTIANLIANTLNEKVLVIDKRNHIAGNSYDYRDHNGIMIHKYGSHIFHTSNEKVWSFIKQFSDFNQYMHKVIGIIDGIETNIPFNLNSLHDVFPHSLADKIERKLLKKYKYNTKVPIFEFQKQNDGDLKFLADYIYEKVFLYYTSKQWGINPENMESSVTARVPVYISKDNRYFQDKYQGIPLEGFTNLIENMLNHKNIKVELNTNFNDIDEKFDRIFYTGSIDEFFNYKFGVLPYRSVTFKFEEYNSEFYQNNSVINYPCNYDFTRIHEFKHYLKDKSPKTIIAKEYSSDFSLGGGIFGERYYPVLKEENILLYNKYLDLAKNLNSVRFLGRLGDYKYYDIDKAILRAINLFEEIKND